MIWLALAIVVLLLCFTVVIWFGAPYLPTLTPQVEAALQLVNLKPGQTLLELGCGDGKVLIAAAQTGLKVIGYELNPVMALIAWLRTRRFKGRVRVRWANIWWINLPAADGIFTFLLPRFMPKVDKKIVQSNIAPVKLVSFAFKIAGKQPTSELKGVFLYEYGAPAAAVLPSGHDKA